MVGATISGGIGSMMGMHGPIADSLLSVRMVTASGKVVKASETQNSDLFWAIRGAGANFGIITSATYRLYDQTANGQGIMATFVFPAAANRSVWELVSSYDDSLPRPLSVIPQMAYNRTSNEPFVVYTLTYIGTLADAQPHIDKALALGPVSSRVINDTVPVMNDALSGGACTNGIYQSIYTIGLNRTDVDTMEEVFSDMAAFYEANPEYNGRAIFQRYSNEVALKSPVSKTSYPWRDIKTFLLVPQRHQSAFLGSEACGLT
jgi:fumiquinazoline A oxidase